jgi:hypothetical protein
VSFTPRIIMEWLYLAMLAPLVLVPVVFLFGYAGCGDFLPTDVIDLPDLGLSFTFDGTTVKLAWNAGPVSTVRYTLFRGDTGEIMQQVLPGPGATTFYADTGRTELARYFYTVNAIDGGSATVGRSKQVMVDVPPLPPSNLKAAATGPNAVRLTWTNNPDTRTDRVVIRRQLVSSGAGEDTDIARTEAYDDATISAATDFAYQIAARHNLNDGTGNSLTSIFVPVPPKGVEGTAPPPEEIFTLAFPLLPKVPNRLSNDLEGDCIIVRIAAAQLQASGTKLRLTLRAVSGLGFSSVTVSQPARTGNGYDSHTDLTSVATNLDLSGSEPTRRTVDYTLDRTQDLLIAFDIKPQAGFGSAPITDSVDGCIVYYKADTRDADKIGARSAGFMAFTTTLAIVEKIEVV